MNSVCPALANFQYNYTIKALYIFKQREKSSVEPVSTGSPIPKRNSERILTCRELKEEGNKLFKSQEWRLAMKKYHHALMYIKGITDKRTALAGMEDTLDIQKPTEQEKKDATELILSLWNNLSCEL